MTQDEFARAFREDQEIGRDITDTTTTASMLPASSKTAAAPAATPNASTRITRQQQETGLPGNTARKAIHFQSPPLAGIAAALHRNISHHPKPKPPPLPKW
jgi:hypothetical protein